MLIIFDLDGTLIDSSKDLAIAMNATREHLGMEPIAPELIYSFVGHGVRTLVQRALGEHANDELIDAGHRFFLAFYEAHATHHTGLYPGIDRMVERLATRHTLAILTNKPHQVSYKIVNTLQLQSYFFRIYGGDSFPLKKPDPVGIHTLMRQAGVSSPVQVLMVGDSSVDVETARNAGVQSCGVLWGFQPESLTASSPDFLIRHPAEIFAHLN